MTHFSYQYRSCEQFQIFKYRSTVKNYSIEPFGKKLISSESKLEHLCTWNVRAENKTVSKNQWSRASIKRVIRFSLQLFENHEFWYSGFYFWQGNLPHICNMARFAYVAQSKVRFYICICNTHLIEIGVLLRLNISS